MDIIPKGPVLIVQIGGFLLVLLVFKRYLFKPIQAMLDARRQEIDNQFEQAEANRKSAEELRAEYEKHLAEIDAEVRATITEAAKEGQSLREEIVADSRKQAEAVMRRAQEEIEREKDKAVLEIKTRVADLAVGAAQKLIEERLDDQKHRELVEKYVDGLTEVSK